MVLDDNDVDDQDANGSDDKQDVRSTCGIRGWRQVTEWRSHRLQEEQEYNEKGVTGKMMSRSVEALSSTHLGLLTF
jgi:hypothetical protein